MKQLLALACAVALMSSAAPVHAQSNDDWTGGDKLAHGAVSAWLSITGYALVNAQLEPGEEWKAAAIAGGVTVGIGAAKELWDLRGGSASGRDFAWDVAGAATGTLSAWAFDRLFAALFESDEPS